MAMPLAILGQHDQLYNKKYTLPTYGLVEYIGPQFQDIISFNRRNMLVLASPCLNLLGMHADIS